jgi:hypothetical protein
MLRSRSRIPVQPPFVPPPKRQILPCRRVPVQKSFPDDPGERSAGALDIADAESIVAPPPRPISGQNGSQPTLYPFLGHCPPHIAKLFRDCAESRRPFIIASIRL